MDTIFPFVQFELTRGVGPEPGRYLVRPASAHVGAGPAHEEIDLTGTADVLVVQLRGAPQPTDGVLRRRKVRSEPEGKPPGEVALTLCTVILATTRLADASEGARLLESIKASHEEQERWIDTALEIVNRAVAAYRACAVDPYAIEVSRAEPRVIRIGYGPAVRVVDGGWDEAISVPPPRPPRLTREERLIPLQGIGAALAGRGRVLESEELLLRVMLDLEHGRLRAAATGLRAAAGLVAGELAGEPVVDAVRQQLSVVAAASPRIDGLAAKAVRGPLAAEDVPELEDLIETVGAPVDSWRALLSSEPALEAAQ